MIKPTVGRIVHYFTRSSQTGLPKGPFAAIITDVHTDCLIDIVLFDRRSAGSPEDSVPLLQDDEAPPQHIGWCQWMDYQKGQAAKTEAAEAAIGAALAGSTGLYAGLTRTD